MDNNTKKIKGIIFDWGGVCCSEGEPFASSVLQEKVNKHPDDICQDLMDLYSDFYRGKYTSEEFYNLVIQYYGLSADGQLNPKEMSQAYIDSTEIWPDMLEMAKELQEKYTVALLSDLTPVMKDYIHQEYDIASYFPIEMYSCDEGVNMVKVDGPEIFDLTLQKMNLDPEETLFVDNSKSKIAVANEMGIKTMLFVNREKFFADIKQIL